MKKILDVLFTEEEQTALREAYKQLLLVDKYSANQCISTTVHSRLYDLEKRQEEFVQEIIKDL